MLLATEAAWDRGYCVACTDAAIHFASNVYLSENWQFRQLGMRQMGSSILEELDFSFKRIGEPVELVGCEIVVSSLY